MAFLSRGLALLLLVTALPASGAVTLYTWVGGTGDSGSGSPITNGANWVGGVAPPSSVTSTGLQFGASANPNVNVNTNLDVFSLAFTGSYPGYSFNNGEVYRIGIGAGGLTMGTGSSEYVSLGYGAVRLLANQTWSVGGQLEAFGITGGFSLTKTGSGTLTLGDSSFTGGFDLQAGTLLLSGSSYSEGGTIIAGPVGTGTLTMRTGTTIAPDYFANVTLGNVLILESGVTFGHAYNEFDLNLTGNVTLQSTSMTINVAGEAAVNFTGAINEASAGTAVTFTGTGFTTLGGTSNFTGGLTANGAPVIFLAAGAIPATGAISATSNGYVGVTFDSGVPTLLGKISSPSTFTGSLGLDTAPSAATTTTFASNLNLAAFDPTKFRGVGTHSSAILAGTVTTVGAGNYMFGGGSGSLYLTSNLTASGAAGLTVASPYTSDIDQRFTLWLRGTNTFTGNTSVSTANLIFDGPAALPAGISINLGTHGYAGLTERTTGIADFAAFKSRIAAGHAATSIIGLDTFNLTSGARTVSDIIDLSSTAPIYLGTATKVVLSGTIKPPTGGTLFLTGINEGHLKITSPLTVANGVASLTLGYAGSEPFVAHNGLVEFTNATSDFTGNTTLLSGHLLIGTSSVGTGGSVTSGPIGRGTLVVSASADRPALAASVGGVTLHNNISLLGPNLVLGHETASYGANSLTLSGTISGSGGVHYFGSGDATLTLNGANTFSGGFYSDGIHTIVANSNTAFGSGPLNIGSGSFVNVTTSAPVIGGLNGYGGAMSLASGSSLTINQAEWGSYFGTIAGTGVTVTKNGTGSLMLYGDNTYSGTTNLVQGTVMVTGTAGTTSVNRSFGTSTVNLAGGSLVLLLETGQTFNNSLTFSAPSRLGGTGHFSAPLTVGPNVTLAPGMSPGLLTFDSGLTFSSGGALEIEMQSVSGAGTGFDALSISGGLVFSTPTTPFTLSLISLSTTGLPGLVSDFNSASSYSWQIASVSGGITGFSTANIALNTSGFLNSTGGGVFGLSTDGGGTALFLTFTPVPEPSTWAMLALGGGTVVFSVWRRRRSADQRSSVAPPSMS